MDLQISKETCHLDHYFMEMAYASELWAAEDLLMKTKLFPDPFYEQQMKDEIRHARMLKSAMANEGFFTNANSSLGIQNVFFKGLAGLDLTQTGLSEDDFAGTHQILERRAVWGYRTYLRGGRIQSYKKVLAVIIEEEREHLKPFKPTTDWQKKVASADRWIYRGHLQSRYNRLRLLDCPEFWDHYRSGSMPQSKDL